MSRVEKSAFRSAELKIEWAKKHINDLDTTFQRFQREGNHLLFLQPNEESGETDLILHMDPLPAAVFLLLGDAVHNLSSALDHAWNVLARASRESQSKLTFPTNEVWDNLVNTVKSTPIKPDFPEIESIVLNDIAPAKGRQGHNLWAIRQLDNLDKHNVIIPAVQVTEARDFMVICDTGARMLGGRVQVSGHGGSLRMTSFQGNAKLYGNPKPTLDIAFTKKQFIEDQPILPALRQTTEAVEETVFLIRDRFSD